MKYGKISNKITPEVGCLVFKQFNFIVQNTLSSPKKRSSDDMLSVQFYAQISGRGEFLSVN